MLEEHYGRHPLGYSHAPFTCGLTGKSYSSLELKERIDFLARGLAKELGFKPNEGSEWDKVIAVFSVNTVSAVQGVSMLSPLTLAARHPPPGMGYPPLGRNPIARERRLQRPGARIPTQGQRRKGPLHMRPAARDSAGGGEAVRHT
jgi:hypothetical protein